MNSEVKENIVASVVDVSSIVFAYNLGVHQMTSWVGLGYACLDAWLVIWQRKRITGFLNVMAQKMRLVRSSTRVEYIGKKVWNVQPVTNQ